MLMSCKHVHEERPVTELSAVLTLKEWETGQESQLDINHFSEFLSTVVSSPRHDPYIITNTEGSQVFRDNTHGK